MSCVGHRFEHLNQVLISANGFQITVPLQLFVQGDCVALNASFMQTHDGFKDPLIGFTVEVIGPQYFDHVIQRLVRKQNAAEHPLLCLEILWRQFAGK